MSQSALDVRYALIGALSLALAMGIGRFAFTPLLPMMREDGLINIMDGGYLASINLFGYLLGALFVTKLSCSPKILLRFSLLTVGISTIAMGLTGDFYLWLMLRFVCGISSALILVLVSKYYLKHLTVTFQTCVFSGVGGGILIAGLLTLLFMVYRIDSAESWVLIGIASLIVGFWLYLRIGSEIPSVFPQLLQKKSQRSPFDWPIVIAYGAMGMGYIIPATYLPMMAREIINSPMIFGWIWPIFGAATFMSILLSVKVQKRYSNRQLWAASQLIMATGLFLPVVYPHIITIIIAGLGVGGTFMIITMAGMKEAHRIATPDDVMRHIAALTTSFATGQMLGPLLAGYLFEQTHSFALSLIMASATLIITAVILLASRSKKKVVHS
ncbi:YbfB/YjiJ family MFS transporter [Kiloniella sp.]|uniref:YbfB/YjiJ family MFS transporter n=1 Tax=Kiloniella sp. TaxID=1938587 RepID=UPI003B02C3BE